jgi:hypothetical protein
MQPDPLCPFPISVRYAIIPLYEEVLNVIGGIMSNRGRKNITLQDGRSKCIPFRLHWARRLFVIVLALSFVSLCMAGCNRNGSSSNESFTPIPEKTDPCKHFEYWPQNIASSKMIPDSHGDSIPRFRVYYRNNTERDMAVKVVGLLDDAWTKEIDTIGFTAPLLYPSGGTSSCGQYASFAVFLWDGHRSCYVTPVDPAAVDSLIPSDFLTQWGGLASYMILDAWGQYGEDLDNAEPRDQLAQTVGHELNHASHAADDFHDIGIAYEMSASFIEQLYGPTDPQLVQSFQSTPEWSLLWYDSYLTWYYMYGSALYMNFLRDNYFYAAGRDDIQNDRFLAELWRDVRNTDDPMKNNPNWVDGINTILAPKNSSFIESVEVFARWRYYAGDRDDGMHFRHWAVDWKNDNPTGIEMPFQTEATLKIPTIVQGTDSEFAGPMVLGNVYVTVERAQAGQADFELTLPPPPTPDPNTYPGLSLRWMVQALPGIAPGSDGETVSDGKTVASKARVAFAQDGKRTLVFTLLPMPIEKFDPEKQGGERYPLTITVSP